MNYPAFPTIAFPVWSLAATRITVFLLLYCWIRFLHLPASLPIYLCFAFEDNLPALPHPHTRPQDCRVHPTCLGFRVYPDWQGLPPAFPTHLYLQHPTPTPDAFPFRQYLVPFCLGVTPTLRHPSAPHVFPLDGQVLDQYSFVGHGSHTLTYPHSAVSRTPWITTIHTPTPHPLPAPHPHPHLIIPPLLVVLLHAHTVDRSGHWWAIL